MSGATATAPKHHRSRASDEGPCGALAGRSEWRDRSSRASRAPTMREQWTRARHGRTSRTKRPRQSGVRTGACEQDIGEETPRSQQSCADSIEHSESSSDTRERLRQRRPQKRPHDEVHSRKVRSRTGGGPAPTRHVASGDPAGAGARRELTSRPGAWVVTRDQRSSARRSRVRRWRRTACGRLARAA